jgi:hypothetical protein
MEAIEGKVERGRILSLMASLTNNEEVIKFAADLAQWSQVSHVITSVASA